MKITPIALTLAAVFATAPAHAEEAPANSVRVEYSDLNLTTSAGQDELRRRLDRAARDVCGLDEITTGTRLRSSEAEHCYKRTRATLGERFADVIGKNTSSG